MPHIWRGGRGLSRVFLLCSGPAVGIVTRLGRLLSTRTGRVMPHQSASAQLFLRGGARIKQGSCLLLSGLGDWVTAGLLFAVECSRRSLYWLLAPFIYLTRVVISWLNHSFAWIGARGQRFVELLFQSELWSRFVAVLRQIIYWGVIVFVGIAMILAAGLLYLAIYYASSFGTFSYSIWIIALGLLFLLIGLGSLLLSKAGLRFDWIEPILRRALNRAIIRMSRVARFINSGFSAAMGWMVAQLYGVCRKIGKWLGVVLVWVEYSQHQFVRSIKGLRKSNDHVATDHHPQGLDAKPRLLLIGGPKRERASSDSGLAEGAERGGHGSGDHKPADGTPLVNFSIISRGGKKSNGSKNVNLVKLISVDWISLFGWMIVLSFSIAALKADRSIWQPELPFHKNPSDVFVQKSLPNILKPDPKALMGAAHSLSEAVFSGPYQIARIGAYLQTNWDYDFPEFQGPVLTPLLIGEIAWRKESSLVFEQDGQPIHYLTQITLDSAALCNSDYIFVVGLASRGGPSQLNAALSKSRAAQLSAVVERLSLYCEKSTIPTIVAMSSSEAYEGASDVEERSLLAFGTPWLPDRGWDPQREISDRILDHFEWHISPTTGQNSMCIYRGNASALATKSIPICNMYSGNGWPIR